ncbi:MAG TPA: GntR family transcriptional regulator [Bacillota bacterium]|nr:GntR family transcriptional regulator [Bacillota bacterium]
MTDNKKPKYRQLIDYLIGQIEAGIVQPGEQIYSENELAARFQISRHTVRQALGEMVNAGWLYRVHGKGTFVRERRRRKVPSKKIGVIITYLNDYIFPAIIRGIDQVLAANGYNIILSCTYNQHEKELICLENMLGQHIDGLIVESTKSALPNPNLDLYRELENQGVQLLFIHGRYQDLDCSYVVEDDLEAGYLATQHLLALGHRKIGGLFKVDDIQGHYRWAGFQKAHREAGLKVKDAQVVWFDTAEADESEDLFRSGRFRGMLSECTAVVCYNDLQALQLLDVLREQGLRVPEDLSVVGFDDSQLAVSSEVKLTTVVHPKEQLGMEAARRMLALINEGSPQKVMMRPELIIRESTARLPVKE